MEYAAPDGAVFFMAFYYKYAAPTALEGWREPAKQRSGQPRQGRNICRKPSQRSKSPVRGDIFRHDFQKIEMRLLVTAGRFDPTHAGFDWWGHGLGAGGHQQRRQ